MYSGLDKTPECYISGCTTIVKHYDSQGNELTGESVNIGKYITLGNHVWLGEGVTVLKNTIIADNCIVGTRAVVSGKFDIAGCVIAGNPGHVIKQGVNWDRRCPKKYNREVLEIRG